MLPYPTKRDLAIARAAVARLNSQGRRPSEEDVRSARQNLNYLNLLRAVQSSLGADQGLSDEQLASLSTFLNSRMVGA